MGCGDITDEINEGIKMKPTQKQPEPLKNVAVTREEVEAARKEAKQLFPPDGQWQDYIRDGLIRFAQRHGAKVRRETIKEAVDSLTNSQGGPIHTFPEVNSERYRAQGETIKLVIQRLLSLTPRGPEKGK